MRMTKSISSASTRFPQAVYTTIGSFQLVLPGPGLDGRERPGRCPHAGLGELHGKVRPSGEVTGERFPVAPVGEQAHGVAGLEHDLDEATALLLADRQPRVRDEHGACSSE